MLCMQPLPHKRSASHQRLNPRLSIWPQLRQLATGIPGLRLHLDAADVTLTTAGQRALLDSKRPLRRFHQLLSSIGNVPLVERERERERVLRMRLLLLCSRVTSESCITQLDSLWFFLRMEQCLSFVNCLSFPH